MTTPSEIAAAPAPWPRRGAVLALCFCIAATEGYDLQAAAVAAPRLRADFAIAPETLGWIFSAGTLGLLIGAALGGRLSDRFGRRPALLASMLIFGILSIIAAFAQSPGQLLGAVSLMRTRLWQAQLSLGRPASAHDRLPLSQGG